VALFLGRKGNRSLEKRRGGVGARGRRGRSSVRGQSTYIRKVVSAQLARVTTEVRWRRHVCQERRNRKSEMVDKEPVGRESSKKRV